MKSSHYQVLNGVKWYYRLKDNENEGNESNSEKQKPETESKKNKRGLFNDHPRNTLYGKFLTCLTFADKKLDKKDTMLLYAVFNSYLDFIIYYFNFPPELRCFYEIILGEYPNKPHFDMDMSIHEPYEQVFNDLINGIIATLKEKDITLNLEKDFCIYTSNKDEKISYHIVINNYCHNNNKEAKAFYFNVMNKLPPEYFAKGWIDKSVYSPTQQFRTLGSHKIGSKRYKTLLHTWKFFNTEQNVEVNVKHFFDEKELADCVTVEEKEKRRFLLEFEESLITARVSSCFMIPSYEVPEIYEKTKRSYVAGSDIDYDEAMAALTLLAHMSGTIPEDRSFPYRLDRLSGPFVVLKRMKPSHCKLCNRIHHNQNPYLLIVPENKNVFFHCRRAPATRNLYVGCLLSEAQKEDSNATSSRTFEGNAEKEEKSEFPFEPSPQNFEYGNSDEQSREYLDNVRRMENRDAAVVWNAQKIQNLRDVASSTLETKKKKVVDLDVEIAPIKDFSGFASVSVKGKPNWKY